jgi:hypothetical protein
LLASSVAGRTSRRASTRTTNESRNSIGGWYGVPGHDANPSFRVPHVEALLAALPINGGELRGLDPADLRELFASLNLLVSYDHTRHSVRLQLTLTAIPAGQGERASILECGLLRR